MASPESVASCRDEIMEAEIDFKWNDSAGD
jgi:hypothetical protein